MRHFNWRSAAVVALTSSVFTAYALAQSTSSSGQGSAGSSQGSGSQAASSQGSSNSSSGQAQSNSSQGQSQASNSNSNNQGQSQASTSNANNSGSNAKSGSSQGSHDANSSQGQTSSSNQSRQDQSNQNRDDRSSTNSTSRQGSTSTSRGHDERDARSDRDDRNNTRDRSSRDNDRNADNRTSRSGRESSSDRDSSRDRSSRRGNMRGPDIGIWFNRSSRDGLVISDVGSRGAIARLGFREGDRIVSVNGHRVTREDEFIDYLLNSDARRVNVIVLRDNREQTIYVEPDALADDREDTQVDSLEQFGIVLDDRYDDRIVVWRVIPRSPAYYAGFRTGDVIVTFGGRPYRSRTDFERGSRDWKTGEANVQIRRGDRTRDLSVDIPNADRRNERSEDRTERTAQRDSTTTDQASTNDRSDRKANSNSRGNNSQRNDSQGNNSRGGILNGVGRGRGNR